MPAGQHARAHVLVPVKRLANAKTRLAESLSPHERATLMGDLVAHVLAVTREAGVGPVTIVSAEPFEIEGVSRFDDRGLPWNDALAAAISETVVEEIAAIVSADLPALRADEVRALVAATPARGIAIGRALDAGTNAVAMRPPGAMRTCFGEQGSAALHARIAADAGLDAVILDLPGLAFDIDTPNDLDRMRRNV